MLLRIPDRNIWLIYVVTLVLSVAFGISISLIALQLDGVGFRKNEIGTLATIFAGGIVALSLPMGRLITLFSAKYTLIGCLLTSSLCLAALPWQTRYEAAAFLRFLDGASSVGIWVASETILLARAPLNSKAVVMSLYGMAMAVGYVVGALLAGTMYSTTSSIPVSFMVASGLAVVSALIVLVRLDFDRPVRLSAPADAVSLRSRLSLLELLYRLKTSCSATFSFGYFQSSMVLFLPLYLVEHKGISKQQTVLIPGIFSLGMLLFSTYAGRLGDRWGQLRVMGGLAAIGTVMIASFVLLPSWSAMCVAIFFTGASLASISALSLALQGHIAELADYSRATGLYNAFYAAGMLVGPPMSSWIFEHRGGDSMLIHLALLWASFVAFGLVFAKDDPAARTPVAGETASLEAEPLSTAAQREPSSSG